VPCTEGYYCETGTSTPTLQPAAGEYAPEGSSFPLLCPRGTYSGSVGAVSCIKCEAGFFCDGVGINLTTREDCPEGFYCPSFDTYTANGDDYRKFPCPKGYYNNLKNKGKLSDCILCVEKKACEEEGMTGLPDPATALPDCAAGYFCVQGSENRFPETPRLGYYGPCPAGYYCAAATKDPTPCPAGTYSPQERAVTADYCLPCPPGKLCSVAGLSAPDGESKAGFKSDDGINETACDQYTHCPLASHK